MISKNDLTKISDYLWKTPIKNQKSNIKNQKYEARIKIW